MTASALFGRWCERLVLSALEGLREGRLVLELPSGTRVFGDPTLRPVLVRVHDPRVFRRIVLGGEIGLGEAYVDGDWSTPDLVAAARLLLDNAAVLDSMPASAALVSHVRDRWRARRLDNSRVGSRRNIHAHYDLGNAFFQLFLDANLMYSCALYERADESLEAAQINKLRAICNKLDLRPGDRVLEIGSGWGGFALFAATRYGCHVTSTTISAEQYAFVRDRIAQVGEAGARIDLRFEDYRDLRGCYDKIVSIEMFEAVGWRHYDEFFAACDRLLAPDGAMLLQTITVDDRRFDRYRRSPNWIAKYIFPGAELASVSEILASLARVSSLNLHHAHQIGTHYARTLQQWRERFHARLDDVRRQGFDGRFIRMWDLYLGYCEAAFRDRYIGDVQLVFAKGHARRALFGEPWDRPTIDRLPVRLPASSDITQVHP